MARTTKLDRFCADLVREGRRLDGHGLSWRASLSRTHVIKRLKREGYALCAAKTPHSHPSQLRWFAIKGGAEK